MIVAERKPLDEIYEFAKPHKKVLIMGCGTCVTVCMAGGEKEVGVLASQLKLAAKERGDSFEVEEHTITRQCDKEFFDEEATKRIKQVDAVISLACGVGAQYSHEAVPGTVVYPGLNTKFYGANVAAGIWSERCAGCGNCAIDKFGGVCPVARCSKSLLNGPCGGSANGKCEVDTENIDCAWQLIYDRMEQQGRVEELEINRPPKDWSPGRDGGPRKVEREEVQL